MAARPVVAFIDRQHGLTSTAARRHPCRLARAHVHTRRRMPVLVQPAAEGVSFAACLWEVLASQWLASKWCAQHASNMQRRACEAMRVLEWLEAPNHAKQDWCAQHDLNVRPPGS